MTRLLDETGTHPPEPRATLAFVYPGQGSQRVGMGTELQKHAPALFDRYLSRASAVAGLPIAQTTLDGSIIDLTQTEITQPAIFALSLALTEHAREAGLWPGLVAGHSLGEYSAAVASGALGFEDGLELVCERARLMAAVQADAPGAMAAVKGLSADRVRAVCDAVSAPGRVWPANFNAPTQTVVSGDPVGVEQFVALAEAAGAEETLVLHVGVAAHSPLMKPVQRGLAALIETLDWREPSVPMVANVSGAILRTAADIRQTLIDQITRPVEWVACVQTLRAAGCTTFLELGSGRVLGGLIGQIVDGVEVYASASPRRITSFAQPLARAATAGDPVR